MPVKFEIEYINKKKRPYYLFARQIIPGENFSISETSFLNGCKLKPQLTTPRASDKDGHPRSDLFTFYFTDGSHIHTFNSGQIVELTNAY